MSSRISVRSVISIGGVAAFVGSIILACFGATESVVVLSTDVDCPSVRANGLEVRSAATSEELRGALTVATSNVCNPIIPSSSSLSSISDLGSLVFIPSDGAESVYVEVALGVTRPVRECLSDPKLTGCIIARRHVGYIRHESLRIPIFLARACIGVSCDPRDTCVAGRCVSSDVTNYCIDGVCTLPNSEPPPNNGGGGPDGSLSVDVSISFDGRLPGQDSGSNLDGTVPGDATSLCPPRTNPPGCVCLPTEECCISEGKATVVCEVKGQCASKGVTADTHFCTANCQCDGFQPATCTKNPLCPAKTCGGSCKPLL